MKLLDTYGKTTILPRTINDFADHDWDDYDIEEEPWSVGREWEENGYRMSDFI